MRIVGFSTRSTINAWDKRGLVSYQSESTEKNKIVDLVETAKKVKLSGRILEAERIEKYLKNPSRYNYPDPKTAKKTHNFRNGQKSNIDTMASEAQVEKIQKKIDDLNDDGIVCLDGITLGANTQYHEALRIKEVALAAQRLIDYQKAKGDVIDKSEALSQIGSVLLVLKEQLRGLPSSLAGRILKCRTEGDVCSFLSSEIDKILKEAVNQLKELSFENR